VSHTFWFLFSGPRDSRALCTLLVSESTSYISGLPDCADIGSCFVCNSDKRLASEQHCCRPFPLRRSNLIVGTGLPCQWFRWGGRRNGPPHGEEEMMRNGMVPAIARIYAENRIPRGKVTQTVWFLVVSFDIGP
jgi:hypothetical protein